MDIKCGAASGRLYVNKFKKAGHAVCVLCSSEWYSPSQFQEIGGRANMKNWKKLVSQMGYPLQKLFDWLSNLPDNPENLEDTSVRTVR